MKKILRGVLCLFASLSFMLTLASPVYAKTGWVRNGDEWEYYDSNGKPHNGWLKDKGKWYYIDHGQMLRNTYAVYDEEDNAGIYYLKDDGTLATGWTDVYDEELDMMLPAYFKADGTNYTGWIKKDGKWYYAYYSYITYVDFGDDAKNVNVLFEWLDNATYAFNKKGQMYTGWFQADALVFDIQYDEEYGYPYWEYVYNSSGQAKTKRYWFYAGGSGKIATGWKQISGKWYYFRKADGWDEDYPYINEGSHQVHCIGAMVTGWKKISGKWYYFASSGAMKTGWLKSSGKWYYFDSSGAMLANTSRNIGGKVYKFNASGVCTNP